MEEFTNIILLIAVVSCGIANAAPRVDYIQPHYGSLNGGSLLRISGEGFAANQFNFGAGNEHLGNTVVMVSMTQSFPCDIHQNDCHERQLGCYTRKMPEDSYYVRVLVDGKQVPISQHCRWELDSRCRFQTFWWSTPTLTLIEPLTAAPGSIIKVHGKIISDRVFSTQTAATNGKTERIRRVRVGHMDCDIIANKDTDELYGIALASEKSDSGWFKCKIAGKYVGNMNVSYIIEGQYGRSDPALSTKHVSMLDQIYMFQTYAVIDEVLPSSGSVEGGTELHIRGNYFDETKGPARVYVGDVPCKVIKPVTETEIVCRTPPKPADKPLYSGNRGVWVDLWFKGYLQLTDMTKMTDGTYSKNDSNYNRTWYDGAGYLEHSDTSADLSKYSIRTEGFFLPPKSGDYRFYLLSDDAGKVYFSETEDPANKTKILECSKYCNSYGKYPTQMSQIFTLQAGNKYYFETLSSEGSGDGYVKLGVKMYETNFVQSQSGDVSNAKQEMKIHSTVVYETQKLSLLDWGSQTSISEIQTVVINADNRNIGDFKLGMSGAWTESLPMIADAATVQKALNNLPSIYPNTVTVTGAGPTFTVTFNGDLGDVPPLESQALPPSVGNVTVTESTPGVPSLNYFQLEMGGIFSTKIIVPVTNSSQNQLKSAIKSMFSVKCPPQVDGSVPNLSSFRSRHFNFDNSVPHSNWGELVNNETPFCGTGSLRKPSYLFRNNGGQINVNIYMYQFICFAYKGHFQDLVQLRYNYKMSNDEVRVKVSNFQQEFINDNQWHYTCMNLKDLATSKSEPQGVSFHKMEYLKIFPENSNTFIDEVEIAKKETVKNSRWPGLISERLTPPMGILLDEVHVDITNNGTEIEITLETNNCEHNFPLFGVMGSQVTSGSRTSGSNQVMYNENANNTVRVDRIHTATPPVTGTFDITYFGENITGIPANIDAKDLESQLRTLPGLGHIDVIRQDTCSGYKWIVTWTDIGGKKQLPILDDSSLSGNNVSMSVKSLKEGGVLLEIIPGEMVRTVENQPQVTIYINNIPTACLGNCSFQWKEELTPVVADVQPTSGSASSNTVLTITGTNLQAVDSALDNTTVIIGGAPCHITSSNDTEIQCNVGNGPLGTYKVDVKVAGKGSARHDTTDKQFTYSGEVTGISPTQGSFGGGLQLNISGSGFANESAVTVGGQDCPVLNYTYTMITCVVPAKLPGNPSVASVIVTHPDGNLNSPVNFVYNASLTAIVQNISQVSSLVSGGEQMVITGTSLKPEGVAKVKVELGKAKARVLSNNDTSIVVELPPNEPGSYELKVEVGEAGIADLKTNSIPAIDYTLRVDAIYPEEGSVYGGTRLTIKGVGYPTNQSLVGVYVGVTSCNIESVTNTQIVCLTEESSTVHTITNMGTHPKYGRGYGWLPPILSIPVGDTIHWQWQVPDQVNHPGFRVYQIANVSDINSKVEGGFNSGPKSQKSSFNQRFTVPGTYHYTSGPIDNDGEIVMMGLIKAMPRSSSIEKIKVTVSGIEAVYNLNSGSSIPAPSNCVGSLSDCGPNNNCITQDANPCRSATDPIKDNSVPGSFNITLRRCQSPVVTEITPRELLLNEAVQITGTGFSGNLCKNEVQIGGSACIITQSTTTTIKCVMDANKEPLINTRLPVSLRLQNKGNAIIDIHDNTLNTVVFKPYFDTITPQQGSLAGGTYITVNGAGFPSQASSLSVSVNSQNCPIKSINYTNIVCETVSYSQSQGLVEVSLLVNGQSIPVNCTATNCSFTYSDSSTANITSISPVTLSGLSNNITLTGDFNLVTQQNTAIHIGSDNTCDIQSNTNSQIVCTISNLVTGSHNLVMRIDPHGIAAVAASNTISVTGNIASITPNTGSINGGTEVTISGGVFQPDNTRVLLGSSPCSNVNVSFDSITCTSSVGSSGSVDVVVQTNGQTITGSGLYSFSNSATPVISSITPTSASAAGTITIVGTGFSTITQDNKIRIGDIPCSVTSSTSNQIQCNFVAMAANQYAVNVLVRGVGKATNAGKVFTYQPTLSSVSPNAGSFGGGQLITLTGSGFGSENSTSVTVCNTACHVHNSSVDQIQCHTPSNSGSGSVNCDIVVTVNSHTTTQSGVFTYEDAKTPIITNVQPRRAGTGGGTKVTITGQRFGSSPSAISIKIAGVPCTIVTGETTSTKAVCITSPIAKTTKTKVSLQVADYGIASQENADFEYIDVWSSVWTWGGGPPPVAGDIVVVKQGQTVLLDTNTPVLKMLLIQGGSFIFDRKDIELNAEYILVTNGGVFQVGTEAEPFLQRATINIHGHLRSEELPTYGAKVFAVREGTLDLHGRPTPITWTHLAQTANAGATQIILQQAVNWVPGDLITLPTTGLRHSQIENEIKTITAVSRDGLTLTLNESLTYKHISVQETLHGVNVELRGEVGLLSHNIKIHGSNDAQWHDKIEACPDGFDTGEFVTQTCFQGRTGEETGADNYGAQIMLHTPALNMGTITARIEFVELNYVGQENRMGRYPIHFHLLGEMGGNYVRGCGIHQSFNRAVNIHGTHNVLVEHNVIYDIRGGAYFLEDGVETGNIFQYNLAVFVRSSTSLLNDDITPASFWVTNPNNTIRHNAAAGGTHFGYWYRMHDHPDGPSFDPNICPKKIPLGEFYNNTAHSFGWFGLWIFQDYFPTADGACNSNKAAPAVFRNLKSWHCEKGAEWVDVSDIQFDGFVMINNEKAGIEGKMMKTSKLFHPDGGAISNPLIVGHTSASKSDECTFSGIILPFDSGLVVSGSTFINFDRNCQMLGITSIDGKCKFKCGGWQYHFKNTTKHNSPNVVRFRWEHEAVIEDLDGTLTGTVGGKIIPTSGINPHAPACVEKPEYSLGINGSICQANVRFIRYAFNHVDPPSLRYKNAMFSNQYGSTIVPWLFKRLTHKEGWMLVMPTKLEHTIVFEDVEHIKNISYDGMFYGFRNQDYLSLSKNLNITPDVVKVKPGEIRLGKKHQLSYVNDSDGDWNYDEYTGKFSYMISDKLSSSRKRRSAGDSSLVNSAVSVQIQKCYYKDCVVPRDPNKDPPLSSRPDNAMFWSDVNTWNTMGFEKPQDGEDVTIKNGYWIVADEPLPRINKLEIDGVLEFEYMNKTNGEYYDFDLHVGYIYIKGGRFIIGWPDNPYLGETSITLYGTHSTPQYVYPPGTAAPPMGSKVIGAFGGLDFHGKPHNIHWTSLAATANMGSNTITVEDPVDWGVGSEVVITTTSYSAWQTETFTINGKSGDSRTLTLSGNLAHRHLGKTYNIPGTNSSFSKTSYKIAAQVGLLTRNIKIVGANYAGLVSEAFGARVLVGVLAVEDKTYTGYARLSNVEFYRTGQEGYTALYDPRYSLAFLEVGDVNELRPSIVSGCSFHHGLATAIGAIGINHLTVENNVVHHTINDAVIIGGKNNTVNRNLVSLVVFPGTYNGRTESANFDFPAGIEAKKSEELILTNNIVAGAERVGFSIPGEPCSNVNSPKMMNNQAQGTLSGVAIFPDYALKESCILLKSFIVQKSFDSGIYLQTDSSYKILDFLAVDNGLGIYPMVLKPPGASHIKQDKFVEIADSYFMGTSPDFDCAKDTLSTNDKNVAFSGQARTFRSPTGGKIGMSWPVFQSSTNAAPRKPWLGIMGYPTIGGLMTVKGVHFSNFEQNHCSQRDVVISPSKGNDDGSHPVKVERITFGSVDRDSKVFIHRPNVGKVNPSDCVDMDCDGMKKVLLKDVDGSFLETGIPGAVIPESEFEWDGDRRRGLGDYRIPKVQLTELDGTRIPVNNIAPNKGIIRNNQCQMNSVWQGYQCQNLDYEMLIIESMDKDTEKRRLSPVSVLGDGYLDLINGPQDHGWCDGYTCQERLSTFMALVATGKYYDIFLSSTNPQKTRFYLLNSNSNQAISLAVYYANPQRLDAYRNGNYIMPNNMELDRNGDLVFRKPHHSDYYKPKTNGSAGENYYDRDYNMQYILVRGPEPIDIVISPVVVIAFDVPSMTIDEFFGENLVNNLATFLGVDSSKVKIVNIVAEGTTQSSRKKRSVSNPATNTSKVEVEISEDPIQNINGNFTDNEIEAVRTNMINLSEKLITSIQLGNFSQSVNITFSGLYVVEPLPSPNDDEAWSAAIQAMSSGNSLKIPIRIPSIISSLIDAISGVEVAGMLVEPMLEIKDSEGDRVKLLGSTHSPWEVTVTLVNGTGSDPRAYLIGNTTLTFTEGMANYTDLAISHSGTGYMLDFTVTKPPEANFLSKRIGPLTIAARKLKARTVGMLEQVVKNEQMSVNVEVIDEWSKQKANDVSWKGHSWACSIAVHQKSGYQGHMATTSGSMSNITIDSTSEMTFTQLSFSNIGQAVLMVSCTTTPQSLYSFVSYTDVIDITRPSNELPVVEKNKNVTIKFNEDYPTTVGDDEVSFKAAVANMLINKYREVLFGNYSTKIGSIIVSFWISGPTSSVDQTIESLWSDLQTDLTLTFGNISLTALPYMIVDGVERTDDGVTEAPPKNLHPAIIAVICIVIAIAIGAAVVLYLLYKTKSGRSLMPCHCNKGKSVRGNNYQNNPIEREVITTAMPPSSTQLYQRMSSSTSRNTSSSTVQVNPFSPVYLEGSNSSSPTGSEAPLLHRNSNSTPQIKTPDINNAERTQTPTVLRVNSGVDGQYYEKEVVARNLMFSSPSPGTDDFNFQSGSVSSRNSPAVGMPEPGK